MQLADEMVMGLLDPSGMGKGGGAGGRPHSDQAAQAMTIVLMWDRMSSLAACAAVAARKIARLSLRRAVSQDAT